ncbi:MAG: AbiV family abortive infection protein [Acidobacteriota bacterium]|nr:AbiV family abortive infection protein [Acidobacteriota bacterium]
MGCRWHQRRIKKCKRLLADAHKLFQTKSYPSSLSLSVLAVEESGKRAVIERILLAKTNKQWKEYWREYTSHTAKNNSWVVPNLVMSGAQHIDDFKVLADQESPHPYVLDEFKMWGFYTECLGVQWAEPEKTITPEIAFEVLHLANRVISNTREVTADQMAAYVKHLSPVWTEDCRKANSTAVKGALKVHEGVPRAGLAGKGIKYCRILRR